MTYTRTAWSSKVNAGDPITISDHDVNDDDIVSFINDLESKVVLKTDQIDTANIKNSAITEAKISNNSITTSKIADANVTTDKLNNKAVTTAKIDDKAVTASQIADNTITKTQIASKTITASEIADTTITGGKLANNTITSTQIASNAIIESKINNGAVTAVKLGDGAVVPSKMYVGAASENLLQLFGAGSTNTSYGKNFFVCTAGAGQSATLRINEDYFYNGSIIVISKQNSSASVSIQTPVSSYNVVGVYIVLIKKGYGNWVPLHIDS